ncbi:MAG TPA: hypothetical protein VFP64_19745 [Pyrinomonadaceae bacterium]|nr:hypothetical protein [Pyrinomonadaceae bacterium]
MISILSEDIYQSPRYELPGIGRFLLQGALVGALLGFAFLTEGLLSNGAYYGYLFLAALPWFLAMGIGFGLLEGAIIWACTFLTGHRLHAVLRAAIGVVVLNLLLVCAGFLFSEPSPYYKPSITDCLLWIGRYFIYGIIFGLMIGSRFDPLPELLRGTTPPRWSVLAAITGFILRVSVIFFLMFSVLVLIWILKIWMIIGGTERRELTFGVIIVSHFIAAVVILFARMPFWLLLPLAIIINCPIAAYVIDVLAEEAPETRVITVIYLHLWAAFLVCRFSVPQWALSSEKSNENRNNWRYWFRRQSSDNSTR